MKYAESARQLGLAVFEDLNRPTEAELKALRDRVGDSGVARYTSDDPAVRALAHLMRATTTARQVKRESSDYGVAPPSGE